MESLEFRLLRAGEEKAALDFFYSNFVKNEGQLCSVGAGWNEVVTRDILAMLLAGAQFPPHLLLFLALIHFQRVVSTKQEFSRPNTGGSRCYWSNGWSTGDGDT